MIDKITYSERYRPQFHFTAKENWLNDPNGCVFHDGEYHLFFQRNPAGIEWGNMTWGHAVSPDLVHWKQLSDALLPYDGGTIFSGSAVVDSQNLSGFGCGGTVPVIAMFTHARQPFGQALAYSLDKGRSWRLHEGGRHIVPNQGLAPDERDPKLFWHAPSGKWIMVLWVCKGQARFFTSPDLKCWTHSSDFIGEGFYECPDFFELPVDGNQKCRKWVLMDARFQYWLGSFDGLRFTPEAGPMPGDLGSNFYAAQTWNNLPGRVVQIGWMLGGKYPDMPFNQQMSFPCELTLRDTLEGVRLCRMPVQEIEQLRIDSETIKDRILKSGEGLSVGKSGDLFDISAEIELPPSATFKIRVHELEISCSEGCIRLLDKEAPLPMNKGTASLRLLVDRTSVELFAGQGRVCMSSCFLPSAIETVPSFQAAGDSVRIHSLAVHRLRSAW